VAPRYHPAGGDFVANYPERGGFANEAAGQREVWPGREF
jgi:hypothetical protein